MLILLHNFMNFKKFSLIFGEKDSESIDRIFVRNVFLLTRRGEKFLFS